MPCPHCGEEVTPGQDVCPNCGTPIGSVWPPAVGAKPPRTLLVQVRLLTGRVWLDEMLGMGLFWLWLFAVSQASSLMVHAYYAYVVRLPLNQEPIPYYMPWLSLGALALMLLAGTYFFLHGRLPKIGRGLGQTALFGVGGALIILLCLSLFR